MNFRKRFLASFLAALLIASDALSIPAMAFANEAVQESAPLSSDEPAGDKQDAVASEQSGALNAVGSGEDGTAGEQQESDDSASEVQPEEVDSPQAATGDVAQDDDDSEQKSYEYLYIAYPVLAAGTDQEIVFSTSNESDVVAKATLHMVDGDGTKTDVKASRYSGALAGFVFGGNMSEGTYGIDSISYWLYGDDTEYIVEFGVDKYSFVVAASAENTSDTDSLDVYYADENGEIEQADSIESALEASGAEAEGAGTSTYSVEPKGNSGVNTLVSPVIALDPGHGANDPGATGNGKEEDDLNWKIASACKAKLEQYGFTVVMTRTATTNTKLQDRVPNAIAAGAQVFVSIHINSASASSASGAEVYAPTLNGSDNAAVANQLAQKVMDNLASLGLKYRGVKQMEVGDEFAVIRQSRQMGIPGILIEHGFISNASDTANYFSDAGCKRLGEADADAIIAQFPKSTWIDYGNVFDADYYLENNPDVGAKYGNDRQAALDHFVRYGMDEGRKSSPNFDLVSYYNANKDLRTAFGFSLREYYVHYVKYGVKEGRTCTGTDEISSYVTVQNGIDYSSVYDGHYYREGYPDLDSIYSKKAGSDTLFNDSALLNHFVRYGAAEGRVASSEFDISSYYNANLDLRQAYGTDLSKYITHYVRFGKNEGRVCTGVDNLSAYATSLNGTDYAPIYDGSYYRNNNSDLAKVYLVKKNATTLFDDVSLLKHFVNHGMNEGRLSSQKFDLASYYNAYSDLRNAYRFDLAKYYMHYLKHGLKEGRKATGASEIMNYPSSYMGIDYSPIYDGAYYRNSNPDLDKAFSKVTDFGTLFDDCALIRHFVTYGMSEGRVSSKDFDLSYYRNRYPDLAKAYGTSWQKYYVHYLKYGRNEGRVAISSTQDTIMGRSLTSPEQMARLYLKVEGEGIYPAEVYSSKGAPTIEDFCNIVYEEATTEGVRAEILFSQILKETGWLKFGGSVLPGQCNFGGLGATSITNGGLSFPDVRTGIRAQVQHLKAYASMDSLVNPCVDPRFSYVKRGCAPLVTDLNGKWAVPGDGYGESILSLVDMLLTV